MPVRHRRWFYHPWVVTAATLVGLIILHFVGWLSPVESGAIRVLRPVLRLTGSGGNAVATGWLQLQSESDLVAENQRLAAAMRQLSVENQRLKNQARICDQVCAQTKFLAERNLPAISARVISKQLSAVAQVVGIDRGTTDNVLVGSPVIVENGVLVGQVMEVSRSAAKVMLLTDGRSVVAAEFDRGNGIGGVVNGEYGASLRLDLVPKDYAVSSGDVVVTSALTPNIPRGLPIGTVMRVQNGSSTFFQTAYLQPMVRYQTVDVVAVLVTDQVADAP